MRFESGDQVTSLSPGLENVIWRGFALPSAGAAQRSEVCSFSSYAGCVTEKTTHLPSGLTAGAPTRGISHIDSCVSGCFGWAEGAAARRREGRPAAASIQRAAYPPFLLRPHRLRGRELELRRARAFVDVDLRDLDRRRRHAVLVAR